MSTRWTLWALIYSNPNCLTTELGLDHDGNERKRPNIYALLLVASSFDIKKASYRLTLRASTSAGRKVNVNYKFFQYRRDTDMSLMYLGIHPLFPVEEVLRVFVEILRIGLNYLKKTKDPDALKIAS